MAEKSNETVSASFDSAVPSEPVMAPAVTQPPDDAMAKLLNRIADLERSQLRQDQRMQTMAPPAGDQTAAAEPGERRQPALRPALENFVSSLEREFTAAWRILGFDEAPKAAADAADAPAAVATPEQVAAAAASRRSNLVIACLLIVLPLLVLAVSLYLVEFAGGGTPASPLAPGNMRYGRQAGPARRPS